MKNRILAAMALCCATSSTMPLWAAEYDDPTIVTVEPNLATDGTGGGKYYIYHVATRKFIAAGNASGTQFIIRKSKFSPNPKRSVHFSSVHSKRNVQKKDLRTTQTIKPEIRAKITLFRALSNTIQQAI